jgi:hypothetical protein
MGIEEIATELKPLIDASMNRLKIVLIVKAAHEKLSSLGEPFNQETIIEELIRYRNQLIDNNYQKYIKDKEKNK